MGEPSPISLLAPKEASVRQVCVSISDVIYLIADVCVVSRGRPLAEGYDDVVGDPLLGGRGGGSDAEGVP